MRRVQKKDSKMQKGTVKWFSNIRNYGFIESNSGQSYFFHRSDIIRQHGARKAAAGNPCVFYPYPEPGKPDRAVNVLIEVSSSVKGSAKYS